MRLYPSDGEGGAEGKRSRRALLSLGKEKECCGKRMDLSALWQTKGEEDSAVSREWQVYR